MDSCSKDYSDLLERVNSGAFFGPSSGVKVTAIRQYEAEGVLEVRKDTYNPLGVIHGGALFTLADTVTGTAAYTIGNRPCVTLDSSMQFLAAARGDRIHCLAKPKKLGRTIVVYDVTLTDGEERLVASGTFTFFVKQT